MTPVPTRDGSPAAHGSDAARLAELEERAAGWEARAAEAEARGAEAQARAAEAVRAADLSAAAAVRLADRQTQAAEGRARSAAAEAQVRGGEGGPGVRMSAGCRARLRPWGREGRAEHRQRQALDFGAQLMPPSMQALRRQLEAARKQEVQGSVQGVGGQPAGMTFPDPAQVVPGTAARTETVQPRSDDWVAELARHEDALQALERRLARGSSEPGALEVRCPSGLGVRGLEGRCRRASRSGVGDGGLPGPGRAVRSARARVHARERRQTRARTQAREQERQNEVDADRLRDLTAMLNKLSAGAAEPPIPGSPQLIRAC